MENQESISDHELEENFALLKRMGRKIFASPFAFKFDVITNKGGEEEINIILNREGSKFENQHK